jgi:hypothetical protein
MYSTRLDPAECDLINEMLRLELAEFPISDIEKISDDQIDQAEKAFHHAREIQSQLVERTKKGDLPGPIVDGKEVLPVVVPDDDPRLRGKGHHWGETA